MANIKDRKPENTVLYIVVPCYNEGELLYETASTLTVKLKKLIGQKLINSESKILFVDDGSKDNSWEIIEKLCNQNKKICGISLAHNRGHQNALIAGLMTARDFSDVTITIDADLQQDVEAIDRFLEEYYSGSEIVYGIRNERDTDGRFKRNSAKAYYKMMRACGTEIYENSADYRLLSRIALDALSEYKEINLFLRGIVTDIGLKHSVVFFDVYPRKQGESKYTLRKMMRLSLDGITSFTIMPIHVIAIIGGICVIISIVMIIFVFIDWILGNTVPGYSTILISIWFVGGMILFGLGVVGEYIGQTYMETKHRPRYFLKDTCLDNISDDVNDTDKL